MHTDRGSVYCGWDHRDLIRRYGLVASMSGRGNCYDNSVPRTPYGGALQEMGEWPPGIGLQDRVPNYVVLLGLRALVVSDDKKAPVRRQLRVGKTNAS